MKHARKPKILLGNIGLDGHELGLIAVSRALRDAGFEVVYVGVCQTPETIVETAIQEDVNVIGIGSMSGIHNEALPDVMSLLKMKKVDNIAVIAGGIIPAKDTPFLKKSGIKEVFGPGTPTPRIVEFINSLNIIKS